MSNIVKIIIKLIISVVAFIMVAVFNDVQEREGSTSRIPLAVLGVFLFIIWTYMFRTKKDKDS